MRSPEFSEEQNRQWDELNKAYHEMLNELQLASEKIQRLRREAGEWYQRCLEDILS